MYQNLMRPCSFPAYQTLSKAGQQRDLLGAKTRELIALAVASPFS